MTDGHGSQNFSEIGPSEPNIGETSAINVSGMENNSSSGPPKCLVDWLVRINLRQRALEKRTSMESDNNPSIERIDSG